jgi:hypothetical protein
MHQLIASGVSIEPVTDSAAMPTVTYYQQVAAKFSAALIAAIAEIPMFEPYHPSLAHFVRSHQSFPNDFISTTVASVKSDPDLQNVNKFNVDEARDTLQFLEAFRPVIDQVAALLANLKFTCGARKARVVADALVIYEVAKALGRDPASAAVAWHAGNMKRDLKRSGPRRKKQAGLSPGGV